MTENPNIEEAQQTLSSETESDGTKGVIEVVANANYPVYFSYASDSKQMWIEKYESSLNYYYLDTSKSVSLSIVDKICSKFDLNITHKDNIVTNERISYVIDNNNYMSIGDKITDFEKEIGKAKIVIIVLSDKYFTSPHCMFEWKKIHEKELYKRIIYVINNKETITIDAEKHCIEGFDLTNIDYKFLLYDRWCAYMKKYVEEYSKTGNKPAIIDEYAFENQFYLKDIDEIQSKIRNVKTKKVYRCGMYDEDVIDEIVQSVRNYIKGNIAEDRYWEDCIENFLWKKTILIVGDNVLKLQDDPQQRRLGDFYDNKILSEATKIDQNVSSLSEWISDNYNDEKVVELEEEGKRIIKEAEADLVLDNSDLKNLLGINSFDKVISFGYSDEIVYTVEEYFNNNISKQILKDKAFAPPIEKPHKMCINILRFICDTFVKNCSHKSIVNNIITECERDSNKQSSEIFDFFKNKLQENKIFIRPFPLNIKNQEGKTAKITCKIENLSDQFMTVSMSSDYKKWNDGKNNKLENDNSLKCTIYQAVSDIFYSGRVLITESSIVKFFNDCMIAIDKLPKEDCYVLILGAKFPSWALRFIWEKLTSMSIDYHRFDKKVRNNSFIDNQEIDWETIRFVKYGGGGFFFDENLDKFFDSLSIIKKKYIREYDDLYTYNIFISYEKGYQLFFKQFVDNYLLLIEQKYNDIHFIWRNICDNDDRINDCISKSKLQILFCDSNKSLVQNNSDNYAYCEYNYEDGSFNDNLIGIACDDFDCEMIKNMHVKKENICQINRLRITKGKSKIDLIYDFIKRKLNTFSKQL